MATTDDKIHAAIIKSHRRQVGKARDTWARAVNAYRAKALADVHHADREAILLENNHLYAFADSLVANVTPTNPAVTIQARKEDKQQIARAREHLVNDLLFREHAHQKLWKLVLRASIFPRAFWKIVWSTDKKRPTIRTINPHYIFFDTTADDWEDIRYLIEVTVLPKTTVERRIKEGIYTGDTTRGIDYGTYPGWLTDGTWETDEQGSAKEHTKWATLFEYYDFEAKTFSVYAEDAEDPLFTGELPYRYVDNPFYLLVFNDNLMDISGMSDAELVLPAINRLNELSSLQLWHNKTSIPFMMVNEALLDNPEDFRRALASVSGPGEAVSVQAKPGVGLPNILMPSPTTHLPVEWGRTMEEVRTEIERTLGLASYQRGELGQSDVATELALTDTAIKTRNARRQKSIYDVLAWSADVIVRLFAERMEADEAIYVRDDREATVGYEELTRENLGLIQEREQEGLYTYQARPYNASEQNSVVRLKMLSELLPVLTQDPGTSPFVNKQKLAKALLEYADLSDLYEEQGTAPPGAPPGMPEQAGAVPGAPPQTMGEAAPGMPAEMQALAQGGNVTAGAGAQMVPGGLEGGNQPG
jgi:hypothetical protein